MTAPTLDGGVTKNAEPQQVKTVAQDAVLGDALGGEGLTAEALLLYSRIRRKWERN